MKQDKLYYTATEVAQLLDISISATYKLLRKWNRELDAKNYLVISGKIPVKYFCEKVYGCYQGEGEVVNFGLLR